MWEQKWKMEGEDGNGGMEYYVIKHKILEESGRF